MGFFEDAAKAMGNGMKKVADSAGREAKRAGGEYVENINKDFDSIATAIDKGGFVGGAVQAADVFSPGHQITNQLDALNVIPEDQRIQELVSGGLNLATASPWSLLAIKDAVDAINASPPAGGPAPAPAQAAERPSQARRAPTGYPEHVDGCHPHSQVQETQRLSMRELQDVLGALRGARDARAEWVKQNPDAPVPTDGHYTIDEILNHPSMSTGEVCCRVVAVIIHEHPEALDTIGTAAGTTPPAEQDGPGTPAAQGQPQQNPLAGIFGFLGPVASFLGPLLGNPMVAGLIGPLLLATPLAPIVPFLPVILPLAGGALTMAGGAMSQMGGQPGGQPGAQTAAQPGGPSPDFLQQLLSAVPAMLGAAPGAAPAPVRAA